MRHVNCAVVFCDCHIPIGKSCQSAKPANRAEMQNAESKLREIKVLQWIRTIKQHDDDEGNSCNVLIIVSRFR